MREILETFFDQQAGHFISGNLPGFTDAYTEPLPVFVVSNSEWRIVQSREHLRMIVERELEALRKIGASGCTADIAEIHETSGGRWRTQVSWRISNSLGEQISLTDTVHYLDIAKRTPRVVMVQCRRLVAPLSDLSC
ncbi:MAG: hypothetical protein AAGH83_01885 [Pseudomonadota bacterium]